MFSSRCGGGFGASLLIREHDVITGEFVLKGGIQSDVSHKTFTRSIRSPNVCQLQLGHRLIFTVRARETEIS